MNRRKEEPDFEVFYVSPEGDERKLTVECKSSVNVVLTYPDADHVSKSGIYYIHGHIKASNSVTTTPTQFSDVRVSLRRKLISPPPGGVMDRVANFLCCEKTYSLVAKPAIADMQHEYFKALAEHRNFKAAWIRIRGVFSFWLAIGLVRIAKKLFEVWRSVHSL